MTEAIRSLKGVVPGFPAAKDTHHQRRRAENYAYWEQLWRLVEAYPQILVVDASGIGSKQITNLRCALRGKATVLFGKSTLIKAGLQRRLVEPQPSDEDFIKRRDQWFPMDELKNLLPLVKKHIGLIFCKGLLTEVQRIVEESKEPAGAKAGSIAPEDVTIRAGETILDPSKTSGFAAMNIPTKIAKGKIAIASDVLIMLKGEAISSTAAALLQKLGILPFSHRFKLLSVYDHGSVYPPTPYIPEDEIVRRFALGVRNVAAISIETGYPTAASLPYAFLRGLLNLIAIAEEADYTFREEA